MKILQTGDLHLGKILHEYALLQDQEHMLNLLARELDSAVKSGAPYDALLLTGDIYDRSVPPQEAVEVFDRFLTEIHARFSALHVFIISGNHDSAARLAFGAGFFSNQNIHICTNTAHIAEPVILTDAAGYRLAVYQIPFLTPGCIESEENSQQALLNSVIKKIMEGRSSKTLPDGTPLSEIPALATAHLFTVGATECDSERQVLGTAEQVDASVFAPFVYTALGHIHKPQPVTETVRYAGSPLAYSFSEVNTQKMFLRIELSAGNAPEVTGLPVTPLHTVSSKTGKFASFFSGTEFDAFKNDFLEIICTDSVPVENAAALLRQKFPFLLSVRQNSMGQSAAEHINTKRREILEATASQKSDADIFSAFLDDMTGGNTDGWQEEIRLFAEIAAQVQDNDNDNNGDVTA